MIQNKPRFIAKQFHASMKGLGTNDEYLISLVIRYRNPSFLKLVRNEYVQLFGKELKDAIESETSGDYKKLLVAIVQDQQ